MTTIARLAVAGVIAIAGLTACNANAQLPTQRAPSPTSGPASGGSVAQVTPSAGQTAVAATSTPVSTPPPSGATSNPWGPFSEIGLDNRPEPDPVLTPGTLNPDVTQATLRSTICMSGFTARIRPSASYTNRLKVVQIAEYGYTDAATSNYEEDHLISLELGGSPRDPANLWPEPYVAPLPDGTPAGARVKDAFENYLRRAVCNGSMALAAAQRAIAVDWVGAWMASRGP